jgi:hypothetical protein
MLSDDLAVTDRSFSCAKSRTDVSASEFETRKEKNISKQLAEALELCKSSLSTPGRVGTTYSQCFL